MITYIEGSLFTSTAQTLVNTVNTAGVMGKGLAKAFKTYYPEMFAEYAKLCKAKEFAVGQLLLYRTPHKWVLNFPTKGHWRQPSRLDDIDSGLATFARTYAEQGISSIAFPQLGCGNGGLDWEGQVRPLMEQHLRELPLDVQVYITPEPVDATEMDEQRVADWLHSEGMTAGFESFQQDAALAGLSRSVADDALWEIWRQLRRDGLVLPDDVAGLADSTRDDVIGALLRLTYVRPARAARICSALPYDARSTQALLELADARGVRFVPPLFQALHPAPAPLMVELEPGCNGSRTTRQLALSFGI